MHFPAMGWSEVSTPVYVDTSLGTHLVVPVSPETTAKEFKRELERMHLMCFPDVGNVRVCGMMVTRKSCYYHLAESLPIKYAFQGLNGAWFLRIEVQIQLPAPQSNSFECHGIQASVAEGFNSVELDNPLVCTDKNKIKCKRKNSKKRSLLHLKFPSSRIRTFFCSLKKKRKTKGVKRKHVQLPHSTKEKHVEYATGAQEVNWAQQDDSQVEMETSGEKSQELSLSVSVSVSGIIKKYFSDYDEVVSSALHHPSSVRNAQIDVLRIPDSAFLGIQPDLLSSLPGRKSPHLSQNVWSEKPSSESTRDKRKKPEVGKRVLQAYTSLGLTPGSKQAVLSLCKSSGGKSKSPIYKSPGMVRSLVFDITNEND